MMNSSALCQGLTPDNYTAIYARHSKIDDSSVSNQSQIDQCGEVASKLNLIVYKSYEDEGSGFSIPPEKRKGFKQLIIDAKAGYFKNLIVWKVDRLWRQTYDYPDTVKLLKSLGVKLIYADMIDFEGMNPIYKNFMTNMFLSIAELEPNRILEKTTDGRNYKRGLGIVFLRHSNFGYTSITDTAFIKNKISNEEAAKVTEIYYAKEPLEAAFIDSCFKIYNAASGDYKERIARIKDEMNTLAEIFETTTKARFKNDIKNISDKFELLPIKNQLKTFQKNLAKYTSEEIKLKIENCCKHCTNPSILQQMLINHHYCGINVIDADNNDKLIILSPENNYSLNTEVFNKAVNADALVDKELWFKVATHVLSYKKLKASEKSANTLSVNIKCGKCNTRMKSLNDIYQCPKCTASITSDELKAKIIDRLIADDIYTKVKEKFNIIIEGKNTEIAHLESQFKKHKENSIKLTLEYIKTKSKDYVTLISTEAKTAREIQDSISKLQQDRDFLIREINKLSPEEIDGVLNLKNTLDKYLDENKLNSFLKSIIKDVVVVNDAIKTKYNWV